MRLVAFALGMLALASQAEAATLTHFTTKEHREVIVLTGQIAVGDADRLVALVKEINQSSLEVSGIRLNSPGGNLAEGAKLADAVRFAKIATVVVTKTTCASACFVVFAAGSEKFVGYGAQVGVHGASNISGQETVESRSATIAMAKIVKELGVPSSIIGQMVVTPPDQMVWLSTADLQAMGVTMVGKPSQTAQQAADGTMAPAQTPASAVPVGAAPVLDKNAQWTQIVNAAIAQSSSQNGGTPNFSRVCQPELKLCNMGIVFRGAEGKSTMVRTAQNMDGVNVARDVCTFNDFGDIRECWNWDTGVKSKEMKNAAGNWYAVGE